MAHCQHCHQDHPIPILFGPYGPVHAGIPDHPPQTEISLEEFLGLFGIPLNSPKSEVKPEQVNIGAGRPPKQAPTAQVMQKEVIWQDHTGRRWKIQDMETSHLINAFKYKLESNIVPPAAVLEELQKRGFLKYLGSEILPRKGYKSPEEIREQFANKKSQRVGTHQ